MATSTRVSEMVSNGDAVIETYVEGRGPALVVLPSYGRDGGEDFDAFAELVARAGFQVLRPQPRGIGRSSGSMQASLQHMANDVAEVIQQLTDGNAAVLGHAFGNSVARLLASSQGELVKGTILAAAGSSAASKEINETPFIAGNPSLPEQDRLAALRLAFFAPNHNARPWLTGWYPETLHMQKAAVQALNPANSSGARAAPALQIPAAFSRAGTAPILQIIAESDPFNPYSTWRELRELCGERVTTRIVADASHALFPEQTPIVADIVIAWLRSLWR
jgi:pimeloyl-ACP methyl ester carboxylesterase